jgi:hypothetical protein
MERTHDRGSAVRDSAMDLSDQTIVFGSQGSLERLGSFKVVIRVVEWSRSWIRIFLGCFICFLGRGRLRSSWGSLRFLPLLILDHVARARCGAYLGRRSELAASRTTHDRRCLVVDGRYQRRTPRDVERSSAKVGERKVEVWWLPRCASQGSDLGRCWSLDTMAPSLSSKPTPSLRTTLSM